MQNEDAEITSDNSEESVSPHALVSSRLVLPTSKARSNLVAEVVEKLKLEKFDADTLVVSAADLKQLKSALTQVQVMHIGQHTFSYIEFDVVTWRILPSPENVRFEDRRLGQIDPYRFGSLSETQAVLTMKVSNRKDLFDDLIEFSEEIKRDSPHTRSIPIRGIEMGGYLSLARIQAADSVTPYGVLESTDGFSRTVGAHFGLQLSARDVLEKFNNPNFELDFRKRLIGLRDRDLGGNRASDEDRTKLRCSVMPRAKVIVGYEYRPEMGEDVSPTFDDARRDLVGHLHMAPSLGFSTAANSAAKARAIRAILLRENQLPVVEGLSESEVNEVLSGVLTSWLGAGLQIDELAPVFLEAYKPNLLTKTGRLVKKAVNTQNGLQISQSDLVDVAVDIAVRTALSNRGLTRVQISGLIGGARSTLSKTWDDSIFVGVKATQRPIREILDAALSELKYEESGSGKAVSQSRNELAAIASFSMAVLSDPPLLERAVGRRGYGNNDEPNKVIKELLKTEYGIRQLVSIIESVRKGKEARLLDKENPAANPTAANPKATAKDIKAIYDEKTVELEELPEESAKEALINLVTRLTGQIASAQESVAALNELQDETGSVIATTSGIAVQPAIDSLQEMLLSLNFWNSISDQLAKQRMAQQKLDDVDLG